MNCYRWVDWHCLHFCCEVKMNLCMGNNNEEAPVAITAPEIKARKYQTLIVPGYTKTETGEIVKEVNLKDFISLIPIFGLVWLAFAL